LLFDGFCGISSLLESREMTLFQGNAAWVDPYGPTTERRATVRVAWHAKVDRDVAAPEMKGHFVGPGIVQDISERGILVTTKHKLQPGQVVQVAIPVNTGFEQTLLPERFAGAATVLRVRRTSQGVDTVALRFGEPLINDLEFAGYIQQLRYTQETTPAAS
jgi:PilZ domain-containing protein